jgi:hypothetical protein
VQVALTIRPAHLQPMLAFANPLHLHMIELCRLPLLHAFNQGLIVHISHSKTPFRF